MRLKDKQTNEVSNYFLTNKKRDKIAVVPNGKSPSEGFTFDSLKEMCERFEDASEETKPFEKVAKPNHELQLYAGSIDEFATRDGLKQKSVLRIADINYYEILPDGTKKTEFTWDEAMEIEKKTHGKWRVPTQAEWYAIAAAFGADEKGEVAGATLAKNLNLTTDEDGYGYFWSSTPYSAPNARYLSFNSTGVYPQYDGNKVNGFTVRCVAGEGE